MADKVHLELVTPLELVLARDADMVVVPGSDGDFGVLPGHAPLLSSIRPGVIDVYDRGQIVERIFVDSGFAEVTPERCTVLAEEAVPLARIGREATEERLNRAKERLEDAETESEKRAA